MVPGWVLGTLCVTGQLAHQEQARRSWCWFSTEQADGRKIGGNQGAVRSSVVG